MITWVSRTQPSAVLKDVEPSGIRIYASLTCHRPSRVTAAYVGGFARR